MSDVFDLIAALLVLTGALLAFGAAIALVRFPNVIAKLHAITKPQVLGLICVAIGIAVALRTWWAVGISLLIITLQMLTAPVSANLLARSSYRSGLIADEELEIDDLADDLQGSGFEHNFAPRNRDR